MRVIGLFMDQNTINWGSIADWVSGVGSLSAAAVALYLAKSAERIRLRGYCGLRVIVGQGFPQTDLFSISVTNVGTRATVVNNIGMQVGRLKKRYAVISMSESNISHGIPHALGDGQEGHWYVPLGGEKKWLRDLCGNFVKTPGDIKSLRFLVYTNHGFNVVLRPEKQFRDVLLKLLEEKNMSR